MKTLILLIGLMTGSCDVYDGIDYVGYVDHAQIDYSDMELEVLILVNEHRRSIGLDILTLMDAVSNEAKKHSVYMAARDKVSHSNFEFRDMNLTSGVGASIVGENVGGGYATSHGFLNSCLSSKGHRSIIENREYTHFGISVEKSSSGKNYFTNIFIRI